MQRKTSLNYAEKVFQPLKLYFTEEKIELFLHANKRFSTTSNLAMLLRLINIIELLNCWPSLSCCSLIRKKCNLRKNYRNSLLQLFCKIGVLRNCSNSTLSKNWLRQRYFSLVTLQTFKFDGCVRSWKFFTTCESKLFQDMMPVNLCKNFLLVKS